jgi:hypothetical protein
MDPVAMLLPQRQRTFISSWAEPSDLLIGITPNPDSIWFPEAETAFAGSRIFLEIVGKNQQCMKALLDSIKIIQTQGNYMRKCKLTYKCPRLFSAPFLFQPSFSLVSCQFVSLRNKMKVIPSWNHGTETSLEKITEEKMQCTLILLIRQ